MDSDGTPLHGGRPDFPVFDVVEGRGDPADYGFLDVGSPVFYYKLRIRKWLHRHAEVIRSKPTILFTVSGAGAGSSSMAGSPTVFPTPCSHTWITWLCQAAGNQSN